MAISATDAFAWMEKIIAGAVVFQSIELILIRKSFAPDGIWSWNTVRREFAGIPQPLRHGLDAVLGDRGFLILLGARKFAAVAVLLLPGFATPEWTGLLWVFLLASTILIALRWRGTFNGGSDYMTIIVLSAVCVGRTWGTDHPKLLEGGLWYVALQTSLSYFVAGTVKLKQSDWRSGRALSGFLGSSYYGVPLWLGRLARNPGLARLGSWGILAFECGFPLALVSPGLAGPLIGLALLFQLANTYAFGLNRFLWAWGAAYPAVYWASGALAGR